ncbi:MAG: LytR family transcriptional regulator [Actinophytocola sp.]|uniref:LytR C-terminal domain-containing protein n=1 Tax=Actinophytocola sp. TaxID=1872138 RepID=UPI0013215E0A|nr:LytR C-terminal domain-containing protein [Actinophytocola sp.]MPZ84989.1 LytR family transcriptional regulator [Actinophytocola sp.]
MTSPDSPSATRPLRVAGLTLLGLAAVALIIGLISVFGGGDDGDGNGDDDAQPPASTSTGEPGSSAEPPSSSRPPSSGSQTPSSSRPPGTTTPPGGTATTSAPGGDGNGEPGKTEPVRVYNNSTIKGLASRAADDFESVGWKVVATGNYSGGIIPTTTVYYRPGTAEEAAAQALGAEFDMRVKPRFAGIEGFPDGVVVIVTNDYRSGGKDDGGKNEG